MEKILNKDGTIKEMRIGEVQIHRHIHYPGEFRLTIRSLQIFGEDLCKDNLSESEIISRVYKKLEDRKYATFLVMEQLKKYTA